MSVAIACLSGKIAQNVLFQRAVKGEAYTAVGALSAIGSRISLQSSG